MSRSHRRHDIADEKTDRAQTFLARQIAESVLAGDVIALRFGKLAVEEIRYRRRRAGNALAAFHERVEIRRARMVLRLSAQAEQIGETLVPDRISAPRESQGLGIGFGDNDKAAEPELGQQRAWMRRPPGGAVAFDRQPGLGRRIEADDMEVAPGRTLGAVG